MIVHYHQKTTYNYRFGYKIPTATQLAQPRRLASVYAVVSEILSSGNIRTITSQRGDRIVLS